MVVDRGLTWGGEYTVPCIDDEWRSCAHETCIILLTRATPINSMKREKKQKNKQTEEWLFMEPITEPTCALSTLGLSYLLSHTQNKMKPSGPNTQVGEGVLGKHSCKSELVCKCFFASCTCCLLICLALEAKLLSFKLNPERPELMPLNYACDVVNQHLIRKSFTYSIFRNLLQENCNI